MACRIRVHQIAGVTGAVGLVCEKADGDKADGDKADGEEADGLTPTGAVLVEPVGLAELLATVDTDVEMLVFLTVDDEANLDPTATGRIVRLVEALRNAPDHVAAIRRVPAVNATKRVSDGVVVEAVDRDTLNLLRTPEVVDRQNLEAMLERLASTGNGAAVNPTVVAASGGGRVLVVDD